MLLEKLDGYPNDKVQPIIVDITAVKLEELTRKLTRDKTLSNIIY